MYTTGQAMDAEKSIEGLIRIAYDKLKASDAASALAALEEALQINYEHPEVKYALKCIHWWLEHTKQIDEMEDPCARAGYILSQWNHYYAFLDVLAGSYDSCQYAIRQFVFSTALHYYQGFLGDGENQHDPNLLLQIGRCYKGVGNYEEALNYLEQAARFMRDDAETLAVLADVYALLSETKLAKALFREAFFQAPQEVDIRSLESGMIILLAEQVRKKGYTGLELSEWLPVYGSLLGVFTVKRELKQTELGRLKQSIFSLENEILGDGARNPLLKPRLINRYFWLLDHYENIQEDPEKIKETLSKIKNIDPAIYEQYIR
jgi:tetratricopeptide (TPR) repeat protein